MFIFYSFTTNAINVSGKITLAADMLNPLTPERPFWGTEKKQGDESDTL